jgi:hypothetical protein
MGRMIFFSILIAAAGLVMLVAGLRSEDPTTPGKPMAVFGGIILAGGAVLTGLGLFLRNR